MNHKTSHAADAAMLSELPQATGFVTSIFLGRGQYATHESASLPDARAVAEQMAAHYRNGRKALVYAQLPSGRQFLVPDAYQPEGETTMPTDTATTETMKTFNKRFNAQRAAKSALGKDAEEGVHFRTITTEPGEWTWHPIEQPATEPTDAVNNPDHVLPPAPDFSAKTHERFRGKLAALVALVEARDIAGIKRFHVNPSSTSPKAIMRYKERALAALEAR